MACPFGFCDECGTKLGWKPLEALVKERWPDRPAETPFPAADLRTQPECASGLQLAVATAWIVFLYPGTLVNALWDKGIEAIPIAERYRSWVPEPKLAEQET